MDAEFLIFSKDRAAQADQLLRSLAAHVGLPYRAHLLYCASTPAFAAGYAQLFAEHPAVEPLDEGQTTVDAAVRRVVQNADARIFGMFVDDDVLIRDVQPEDAPLLALTSDESVACVSLRLAPHKLHSQTHGRAMRAPAIRAGTFDFDPRRSWRYRKQRHIANAWQRLRGRPTPYDGCWQVPFSVDGNLYLLERFREFCAGVPPFPHATAVEPVLMKHRRSWPGPLRGALYPEERLVNLVMNNVDSAGERYPHPGHSIAEANARYLAGERLDSSPFEHGHFDACHVETAPIFTGP